MSITSQTSNIAAVLHGKEDLRLEPKQIPELQNNEVLLSMGSVGICGSDLKYWKYGACGRFTLDKPMVIGHEGSGTVVKVGPNVKTLKEGDRVAVEPGIPCRECDLCKQGRYNLCTDISFCATPPVDGNICQYYVHKEDFCFKLPDNVSLDEGALMEPLSVAVYSCERGNVGLGSKVLICGAGPVGIMAMMVAKCLGASQVIMTDIDEFRLRTAKSLGADFLLNVKTLDPSQISKEVNKLLGTSPDVTLECAGSDACMVTGILATKQGGCLVLVGRGSMEPEVPIVEANMKEVDIKGVFRYANCYPKALSMVANGLLDVKPLISHHFQMEETVKAFETAYSRDSQAIKVMIHC